MSVTVRPTVIGDIEKVMSIYNYASEKMRLNGNPNQWINGYPSVDVILADIAAGDSYVVEEDGKIVGVFTFIIGDDPTYADIDGQWLNDNKYGTIHRIASALGGKGVADICLKFCRLKNIDIRVDTHSDNKPMLGWIESRGFRYCGTIRCHNGTPREAFQLTQSANGIDV